ncbi:uncharacterized protein BDV14DRAFT_18017 [Aspergillus stella-maris]|uniref:uncharacterized protein n=1 Tax=Aspergillus stella-maris TaxID=1810926 RepID=UPI003CCD1B60
MIPCLPWQTSYIIQRYCRSCRWILGYSWQDRHIEDASPALLFLVIRLAFLERATSEMQTVTSSSFSKYLSEAELADLNDSVNQHLLHSWPTTNRLSPHDRVKTVVENAVPVLINQRWTQEPGLRDLTEWKIQACISLNAIYQQTANAFFLKQHTTDLLGQGARILYETVRHQLGVPFHQGFVEHPTPESETLDDRSKKTIGS